MDIIQHEVMEEEGTKELIKLTKAGLNSKLNSNDVSISSGAITIQEHQLIPMTDNEVTTMWNNTTPT